MSRVETMAAERWRVTVMTGDRVTHEAMFDDDGSARAYYRHVDIGGSTKVLARRGAGESRFETVISQFMPTVDLWRLS